MAKVNSNISQLMNETAKEILQDNNNQIQSYISNIFTSIVSETPVLTGKARRNWQANNYVDDIIIEDATNTDDILANFNINVDLTRNNYYYIYNMVPYIKRLNQGYSAQAPAGYIDDIFYKVEIPKHTKSTIYNYSLNMEQGNNISSKLPIFNLL